VPIDVKNAHLDLVTLNAHKIHGPKGVGALFIKHGIKLTPLHHGGGHEKGLRSGTENVPGIVGFAKAVEISDSKKIKEMAELRDYLIEEISKKFPNAVLNGPTGEKRLANNVNITFPESGEFLRDYLNSMGICVSKGSACSMIGAKTKPSHILLAIGRTEKETQNSIRFTLSRYTSPEQIQTIINLIKRK